MTQSNTTRLDQAEHVQMGTNELEKAVQVNGDTANRFEQYSDGDMWWGSGSAALDTNLYRNAADELKTDDTFDIATLKLAGTAITATAAEINRAADVSGRVVTLATATSITEATHDGKILLLTGTGSSLAQTLPAATGSGAHFRFVVGAVNTSNHVIQVTGNDVMYGNIWTNSTGDTPDLGQPWPTASDSDTITLNGTTTGGQAIGDMIQLIDIATDKWLVLGHTTTSGTEATPFSAAV